MEEGEIYKDVEMQAEVMNKIFQVVSAKKRVHNIKMELQGIYMLLKALDVWKAPLLEGM